MAKLLVEQNFNDVQTLVEAVGHEKKYKIHGIFAQAETKNRNGRVYPRSILEREINKYYSTYISKKRALGELGHPESVSINLDRVSHLITELTKDGDNYIGTAEIIDTPCGKIVKNLLDAGVQLGVSTRGVGSLKESNGYKLVGEDFFLATVDIVADPSAPEAFVTALRESKEWVMENGVWTEQVRDKYKKMIDDANRSNRERVMLEALSDFMLKL